MFTCDNCHREKPDHECVAVNRVMGLVVGVMSPLKVSVVCRRCSARVRKLGLVAVVGILVIGIVTLVILDVAGDFLS